MTEDNTELHELVLQRRLDAPRHALYRAWTEPELLVQWFAPEPWSVAHADLDPRPGGIHSVTMQSPEGEQHPGVGVYLEVVPDERIVFTDAFRPGWEPSETPFMTAIITFEDDPDGDGAGDGDGDGTLYTARVRHWSEEDRQRHEEMGFQEGWGQATDQLEEVARGL